MFKFIFGIVTGIVLFLTFVKFYNGYYEKYIRPQELVNWYVSCLAETSNRIHNNRDWQTTTQTPTDICTLTGDQIKSIQGGV